MEKQNRLIDSYGRIVSNCRMCKSDRLEKFLDLGFAPPSDAILYPENLEEPELMFPLHVCQCKNCGLTQLGYAVNPELMYGYRYMYESSITNIGKKHFFSMASDICKRFNIPTGSLVVDIGSNVGVLLEGFKDQGMDVLGVDPAPRMCDIANSRGIETIQDFVNPSVAEKIVFRKGKAQVVTGTNVFAHIDDKKGLMQSLETMLSEEGIFIVEAPYLGSLIKNLEYDTIYLEHLEYLSLKPVARFFDANGLDLFDVQKYDIHGKSLRYFGCKKGKKSISRNVKELLAQEETMGIYDSSVLKDFARRVEEHRYEMVNMLREIKKSGKRIAGISAPAKGNTLLNYCKIGPELVEYITEKSLLKQGKYTPGMHIPIVKEERLYKDKPDYGLVLAWNFAEEIMANSQEFKKAGGKFIIPIPNPIII